MAFSSCLCHHRLAFKINLLTAAAQHSKSTYTLKAVNTEFYGMHTGCKLRSEWSFAGGSRSIVLRNPRSFSLHRKNLPLQASWFTSPHLAGDAFTLGTAAVLPFYTLMVAAPKAELTKKCMRSSIPFVVLGVLYSYLLYLSWTPDTIRYMFASKYWLPELPGVAKMFSNEMTLASAWIHLLAVDLYAARKIGKIKPKLEVRVQDVKKSIKSRVQDVQGPVAAAIREGESKTSREAAVIREDKDEDFASYFLG